MNKIFYISGDGIRDQIENKIYTKHFISDSKNYFITTELKSLGSNCEIINFSWWFGHPRLIAKLLSFGLPGSTMLKIKVMNIINFIAKLIIYWKTKTNFYDLIIFSDNLFFLDTNLLKNLKNFKSSKIILFSGVSPKVYLPKSEKKCIPYFDKIFISDPGHEIEWKDYGAKSIYVLPLSAGSPNSFQKIINENNGSKIYDIVFIGRLDTNYEYRLKILNYLIIKGVDIKIWTWYKSGEFVNKYPLVKNQIVGSAYGKEMVYIYSKSKIVLNIHNTSVPLGGNIRLFEIPITKSLQIADKCPSEWFKDGEEIVLFKGNDDLLVKIDYYLNNEIERTRIVNNGYKRLLAEHTYKHRMKKFLNLLKDEHQSFKT